MARIPMGNFGNAIAARQDINVRKVAAERAVSIGTAQ